MSLLTRVFLDIAARGNGRRIVKFDDEYYKMPKGLANAFERVRWNDNKYPKMIEHGVRQLMTPWQCRHPEARNIMKLPSLVKKWCDKRDRFYAKRKIQRARILNHASVVKCETIWRNGERAVVING